MSQAPICKVHHAPMSAGRKGGWYCPRKVGEDWCKERMSNAEAEESLRSRAPAPAPAPGATASAPDLLAAACLELAGRCYAATPVAFNNTPTMAVTFAIQALAAMKAVI